MIQTEIKNLQCESYHVANGEIGVDLDKMLEVLKSAKKGDLIRIVTLPDIHKIEITVNGLVRTMAPIDTAGMTDPKIPNLNFPVKFDIDGKSLLAIVKQCGTVSDHVKITANLGTVIIDAEGDTDKVHAVLEVSGFEARDMPVSSMFPLDYLENFLKTVKGEILSIYLGNDYPVKATWETGVFLLAPRIESD